MADIRRLTLLHNNDIHGDFLSEKIDDKYVGGISLLSGYVKQARETEEEVIYAVAGDMFRGSVIDSEYKGMSTIELMNLLAPDVATIGNHEVDYGVSHLLFIEKCARFPIINANLYITSNGARLFSPYRIVETDNGLKILFIGLVTEEVLAQCKQEALVGTFIDTKEAADEVAKICNAYNAIDIDFTVLLTHIGIEEDIKLADMLDPALGVDLIIGGHSHTFMEQPIVENGIIIAHAGTGTDYIGRFDLEIDKDTNTIADYTWQFLPINNETSRPDEDLIAAVEKYKGVTDRKYNRVLTRFYTQLTHPARNQETALGNLIADMFQESLGVDFMFCGSGSIRCEKMGPIVDLGDLNECFPYDDQIYMLTLEGDDLRHMIKYMLRDDAWTGHTEFYQFAKGTHVVYSKSTREMYTCSLNGEEIQGDKLYTVGMQTFHYMNVEQFLDIPRERIEAHKKPRVIATSCTAILEEYMTTHELLYSEVEGRITILP